MTWLHGLCNLFNIRKTNWPADILKQHQPLPILSLREGFCELQLYPEELRVGEAYFSSFTNFQFIRRNRKELLTVEFNLDLAYFELN
jgi:hypothetical protein